MSYTKIGSFLLVAILCSLFHSTSCSAEESYKRFTVRNWTYRDGTEAKGKLISVTGPVATLRLEGKGAVRVPLEKLSVKDLNWIYEYYKRKKQLSFLPPKYRKLQVESAEPQPENPSSEKPKSSPSQPDKSKSAEEKSRPTENEKEESYKPLTVREWTLQDGNKYKARFLSILDRTVTVLKESGGPEKIPLDKLSKKDLDWVIEYHRRNKLLALLPAEFRSEKPASEPATNLPNKSDTKKRVFKAKGLNEIRAEHEAKVAAMKEELKKESALKDPNDDPNVIKANTDIDPALVNALRGYRVWSDKKGKKSEARFMGISGREISFSLRTVGFVRIPIGTLIEEDLQLLRDALKMHGRFDELPLVYREPLDPNLSPIKLKQIIRVNNHRKWTDLSGKSMGASYVKMEDGKVSLINTKTSIQQEFPYLNFSPEDQEYVQERLKKEIPGQFFPEEADSTLTPEEKEKEFRVWIDRNNRKIKGKFVRLAYGKSVAVINTGKKEELFITEFFSDQDLSLIKPKPKPRKQTDQLAMNNNNATPRFQNIRPGFQNTMPGHQANSTMPRSPFQSTFQCPICNKNHTTDSPFFERCPHCGVKASDTIYECRRCRRKFTSVDGNGISAPCPHCNKNRQNQRAASNNNTFASNTPASNASSHNSRNPDRSKSSAYNSGYAAGQAFGKVFRWVFLFCALIGLICLAFRVIAG